MSTDTEPTENTGTGETPKLFTQDDVNRMISERLNEDRSKREKENEKKRAEEQEQARIAALQGEEKVKAEYEARLKAQADELAETKRSLAITRAESKLASLGLPTELASNVLGSDDKETDAKIAALNKAISEQVAKKVQAGLNHGAPLESASTKQKDDLGNRLDRIMGTTQEK